MSESAVNEGVLVDGFYLEDFEVGQRFKTGGRTVTETDVLNYAGLSGDFNPLHIDAEFAAETQFGQRIAHGPCVYSIASGLVTALRLFEGTAIAFAELKWRFLGPVFIGDTINVELEVNSVRPSSSKPDRGVVVLDLTVRNQDGDSVQEGSWTQIMKSKG